MSSYLVDRRQKKVPSYRVELKAYSRIQKALLQALSTGPFIISNSFIENEHHKINSTVQHCTSQRPGMLEVVTQELGAVSS